jgi:hypothetical protein
MGTFWHLLFRVDVPTSLLPAYIINKIQLIMKLRHFFLCLMETPHIWHRIGCRPTVSSIYSCLLTTSSIWLADACLCQRRIRSDARTRCTNIHRASCPSTLPPGEDPVAIASAYSFCCFLLKSKLARSDQPPFCLTIQREGVKCRKNDHNPHLYSLDLRSGASFAGSCCIMAGEQRLVDPWNCC